MICSELLRQDTRRQWHKSSSLLFAPSWSFTASTSRQVYQCLQINELYRFAFRKRVRVRRKCTGRDDVTGLCPGAHKRAVKIPDHRFPNRSGPSLALNGDELIVLTQEQVYTVITGSWRNLDRVSHLTEQTHGKLFESYGSHAAHVAREVCPCGRFANVAK